MKIAVFEAEGWEKKILEEKFPEAEISLYPERLDAQHIPERRDFEVVAVFVNCKVDEEVLSAFPELKLVTTRSTGFDHIDIEACKNRGIVVNYVPGYGDNTVAELAFGLLLSLSRHIYRSVDQIKETGSFALTGFRGFDLKGKTIGVIGTGRIGKESIKIAKGFGMHVVAYDLFPDQKYASENDVRYLSLEELLGASDVITIHAPLTKETFHLINKGNIEKIKKGCVLINTARGPIVETDALIQALEKGILGGAGLDVLEDEGQTKDEIPFLASDHPDVQDLKTVLENHVLIKMPNVLITPHNAFNTQEALERILATTITNIESFVKGTPSNTL